MKVASSVNGIMMHDLGRAVGACDVDCAEFFRTGHSACLGAFFVVFVFLLVQALQPMET